MCWEAARVREYGEDVILVSAERSHLEPLGPALLDGWCRPLDDFQSASAEAAQEVISYAEVTQLWAACRSRFRPARIALNRRRPSLPQLRFSSCPETGWVLVTYCLMSKLPGRGIRCLTGFSPLRCVVERPVHGWFG